MVSSKELVKGHGFPSDPLISAHNGILLPVIASSLYTCNVPLRYFVDTWTNVYIQNGCESDPLSRKLDPCLGHIKSEDIVMTLW